MNNTPIIIILTFILTLVTIAVINYLREGYIRFDFFYGKTRSTYLDTHTFTILIEADDERDVLFCISGSATGTDDGDPNKAESALLESLLAAVDLTLRHAERTAVDEKIQQKFIQKVIKRLNNDYPGQEEKIYEILGEKWRSVEAESPPLMVVPPCP